MKIDSEFIRNQNKMIKKMSAELGKQKAFLEKHMESHKLEIESLRPGLLKDLKDCIDKGDLKKIKEISKSLDKEKSNKEKSNKDL